MIIIGEVSILLALISSLLSVKWKRLRYITTIFVIIASLLLLYIILVHDFQFKYVYEYTSIDLSVEYLISAFWAGQEGSLLLWILILSILRIREFDCDADKILAFIQSSLIFILHTSGIFAVLPKIPNNGLGLNPLLQDLWMAIHPPIVFIGYATLTIPFAYGISALIKQDYDKWIKRARLWILVSWIFLTLGLAIGGLWAYEVLGWGGYWSWDPVESSSLIPWLISTALLHGVILQRNKGNMKVTNIILSILSFVSVVYATFVTRSGIIESVHAFSESPAGGYYLTIIFATLIISAILFIRNRNLFVSKENSRETANDTLFYLTVLTLCASSFAIFWGITFPIFWNTLTGFESNLNADYYNQTNMPIIILLLFILFVCIIKSKSRRIFIIPALIFLGIVIINPILALIILCFLIFITNIKRLVKVFRGGYISHIGVAILLIGVLASSLYTSIETVSLTQGQKSDISNGYSISLNKVNHESSRGGMVLIEDVTLYLNGNEIEEFTLSLKFHQGEGFEATPNSAHIVRGVGKDVYVIFQGVSEGQSIYSVKFIPLAMLVWTGVILISLGAIVALIK